MGGAIICSKHSVGGNYLATHDLLHCAAHALEVTAHGSQLRRRSTTRNGYGRGSFREHGQLLAISSSGRFEMCMKHGHKSFPTISWKKAQDGKAAMAILMRNPIFRKIAIEQKGGVPAGPCRHGPTWRGIIEDGMIFQVSTKEREHQVSGCSQVRHGRQAFRRVTSST